MKGPGKTTFFQALCLWGSREKKEVSENEQERNDRRNSGIDAETAVFLE